MPWLTYHLASGRMLSSKLNRLSQSVATASHSHSCLHSSGDVCLLMYANRKHGQSKMWHDFETHSVDSRGSIVSLTLLLGFSALTSRTRCLLNEDTYKLAESCL